MFQGRGALAIFCVETFYMDALEKYLLDLRQFRSVGAGVPETSYYSALSGLLDAVGAQLKPKVSCIAQLANQGAGSPDYGFYTNSRFQTSKDDTPLPGQVARAWRREG